MSPILKNIIVVIVGWIGGSIVNMGLIRLGHLILPIGGIDPNDMEAYAAAMPDLDAKYFLFPFLAHALGTFVGAILASIIAASHKMKFALGIGVLFFLGGIMINYMLPGPRWFIVLDLLMAYIPMAWMGGQIGIKMSNKAV